MSTGECSSPESHDHGNASGGSSSNGTNSSNSGQQNANSGGSGNGNNAGQGNGNSPGQGNGRGLGDGTRPSELIFADPRILEAEGNFQLSQYGEVDQSKIEVLSLDSDHGEKMDYSQVMGIYEKQALRDLSDSDIPQGMESVVKDYFIKINN